MELMSEISPKLFHSMQFKKISIVLPSIDINFARTYNKKPNGFASKICCYLGNTSGTVVQLYPYVDTGLVMTIYNASTYLFVVFSKVMGAPKGCVAEYTIAL